MKNLPELDTLKNHPHASIEIVFRVKNIGYFSGIYSYHNNQFYSNFYDGVSFYCDEVIEWWPMPEINTGVNPNEKA